jgi:hypothetical protein
MNAVFRAAHDGALEAQYSFLGSCMLRTRL